MRNTELINKLKAIDLQTLDHYHQYLTGPAAKKNKAQRKEFIGFCALMTASIAIPWMAHTDSDPIIKVILVSLVIAAQIVFLVGVGLEFLHDHVSPLLIYPSMRIREKKYKQECEEITASISAVIEAIEGNNGFIWRFAGIVKEMDSELTLQERENIIYYSLHDRAQINNSEYGLLVKDLQYYYEREPIRNGFIEAVEKAHLQV